MNKNIGVANLFGILACVLLAFREQLSLFSISATPITVIANLLIILCVLFAEKTKFYFALIISLLIIYRNIDAVYTVDLVLIAYVLKYCNLKTIIVANIIFIMMFVLIWQFALSLGILNSYRIVYDKGVAYTFGYHNTNGFGLLFFQIACSIFLILKNRFYVLQIILYALLAYLCFTYSASRTSTISIVLLVFLLISNKIYYLVRYIKWIMALFPLFLFIAYLYFTIYKMEYGDLNSVLSGRLNQYDGLFINMSVSDFIFGNELPKSTAIDGSIIYMLLLFGLFGMFSFFVLFYRLFVYKINYIYSYIPFVISMFLYGITESIYVRPHFISFVFWYLIINPDRVLTHQKEKHLV